MMHETPHLESDILDTMPLKTKMQGADPAVSEILILMDRQRLDNQIFQHQ